MSIQVFKNQTVNELIASHSLATLDEGQFIAELAKIVGQAIASDHIHAYKILADDSVQHIFENGQILDNGRTIDKGVGVQGYIVKNKKAYFSNNVSRDPIFSQEVNSGVKAEICFPVVIDGFIIGSIHLQNMSEGKEFNRDHILFFQELLNQVRSQLLNLKMYLSSKFLNETLKKAIEQKEKELQESRTGLKVSDAYKINEKEIIHKSPSMKEALQLSDKIADKEINVLLTGEAGTGKEMIARRIHCRSLRRERAFVSVDCMSINERQLEAELFGEEIFDRVKPGLLEMANGGTLFLNNVETLTMSMQNKLAQFLANRIAHRVGSNITYRSDVRVISATTKNLLDLIESKNFREDLFYALNTVQVKIPSLKERKEDIELLAVHFMNEGKNREAHKSLSPQVAKILTDYHWPGNVRELQNAVERAYILAEGQMIEREHIDESIVNAGPVETKETKVTAQKKGMVFPQMTLEELEKTHIVQTLESLGGNKTKTAKALGITVKTLYNKLHSYGMVFEKEA